MKRIGYLTLAFCLFLGTIYAKKVEVWESPSSLYTENGAWVLDRVELRDTATVIIYHVDKVDTDKRRVHPDVYLSDSKGTKLHLMSAEGIQIGKLKRLPQPGRMEFALNFEPLPKGESVFDVIDPVTADLLAYGVHNPKKTKAKTLTQPMAESSNVPDTWKKDMITLIGRLHGYDCRRQSRIMESQYHPLGTTADAPSRNSAWIHPDGSFTMCYQADRPCMSYLYGGGFSIPYYAVPGDTLYMEIDMDGRRYEPARTRSAKGLPTHEGMLRAYPFHLSYEDYFWQHNKYMTQEDFLDQLAKEQTEWEGILNYLSRKYTLTAWENHLLHERMRMTFDRYRLMYVSERESGESWIVQDALGRGISSEDLDEAPKGRYDFLRNVNIEDSTRYMIESDMFALINIASRLRGGSTDVRFAEDGDWKAYEKRKLSALFPGQNLALAYQVYDGQEKHNGNKGPVYDNIRVPNDLLLPYRGNFVTLFPVVPQRYPLKNLRETLAKNRVYAHVEPRMKFVYLIDRDYEDMDGMDDLLRKLEGEEVIRVSDEEFGNIMESLCLTEHGCATFDEEGRMCRRTFYSNDAASAYDYLIEIGRKLDKNIKP